MSEHCLRREDVLLLVQRGKSWLHEEVRAGRFPPADHGRWYQSDLDAYFAWRRKCVRVGSDVGSWLDHIKKVA